MEFEFDVVKSASNKEKHGIDFIEAQELWNDGTGYLIQGYPKEEPRFLLIARLGWDYWTAVFTLREERLRLISVRKSRDEEKRTYDNGR